MSLLYDERIGDREGNYAALVTEGHNNISNTAIFTVKLEANLLINIMFDFRMLATEPL